MFNQTHVRDDFWLQQANGVARHRIAETGIKFLGDCGSANNIAPLDNPHLKARAREVEGADKAVMAAADDESVDGHESPA